MLKNGTAATGLLKQLSQLVRLPNVLIIAGVQFLLRYCIIEPLLYGGQGGAGSGLADFTILVVATVLIAVGGYVINDYFDVKIDRVNRPEKMLINRLITGFGAIRLHIILNGVAIMLGFYLAWRTRSVTFGLIFPFISGLLWIYSAKYKRVLFWGNFMVASLSAFVILLVWLFEFFILRLDPELFASVIAGIYPVTVVFAGYAAFAFLVSMAREIIKDMEDMEGDASEGCKTLPIVTGLNPARIITGMIILFTMILLAFSQLILYKLKYGIPFWYLMMTVQPGAAFLLYKLYKARSRQDYHVASKLCKLIMVAGILSMVLIFN